MYHSVLLHEVISTCGIINRCSLKSMHIVLNTSVYIIDICGTGHVKEAYVLFLFVPNLGSWVFMCYKQING